MKGWRENMPINVDVNGNIDLLFEKLFNSSKSLSGITFTGSI
jgi:hypothetical protein